MPRLQEFESDIVVYGDAPEQPTRRVSPGPDATPSPTRLTGHQPLTIVAQDPSVVVGPQDDCPLTVTVDVPAEPLRPGPRGQRFFVVDFTAGTGRVDGPHVLTSTDLTDSERAWCLVDALPTPSRAEILGNRRFHAQNVFATCAALLAKFEQVLGRRISWSFGAHQLSLVPHAFEGGNAGYSPDDRCISFGYLPNVDPSAAVYTCLSHDVIAHELTHALLDGMRPRYTEPGLPDQLSFHEGFADIVALLSVFGLTDVVERSLGPIVAPARGRPGEPLFVSDAAFGIDHLKDTVLFGVGEELGRSLDPTRRSLRSSLHNVPTGAAWRTDLEFEMVHTRGEVLVAAVCHAVAELWGNRLVGIRRYGKVPLRRAAEEGAKVAGQVLVMCIRALDYLPPINFEFSDFIDAMLVADEVVAPDDPLGYRDVVKGAFELYDIRPPARVRTTPTQLHHPWRHQGINLRALATSTDEVFRFLWQNADNLGIDLDLHLHVDRVLAATRTGPDGLVVEEIVADYTQTISATLGELPRSVRSGVMVPSDTPVQMWGGGVIVFDQWGTPRHHVTKDILATAKDRELQRRRFTYLASNHIIDSGGRLGFSTGTSDSARFRMLHDHELYAQERW